MEEILKVKDLKTYFYTHEGVVKAVDGVSFNIRKGETLGIVGESGSGKTVTALSILKLITWPPGKVVSGDVFFNSINLMNISKKRMQQLRGNEISMIFQDPMTSLNPVFTIGVQIMESLILHKGLNKNKAFKKAIELLSDVDIPNPDYRIREYPHKYSGGMRQRAMIAMALSCNPKILIADEPTTALDVTIQAQILRLMTDLKNKYNSSIIIITHDLGVIAKMADRVAVMYAGKIIEYSDAETIFYNSKHPYTWGLINSIPRITETRERLYSIKGNPISVIDLPEGCNFNTRCECSMDICFMEEPELKDIGEGHKKACFLSDEQIKNIKKEKENILV